MANLIGQHGTKGGSKGPPIRYVALREALMKLASEAVRMGASVHMPRIGCGLAGGKWEEIGPMIEEVLCAVGVGVTVYDVE